MRQVLTLAVFLLATLTWTMAQQSGASAGTSASGSQATSPSSQTPNASQQQPPQSQPSAPGSMGQNPAPNSQTPKADQSQPSQSQPSTPGSTSPGSTRQNPAQSGADPGTQGQAANAPVTEGCLGGTNPNFTITDQAGTTYKLNIPPGADVSVLTPHIGESVRVMGQVTNGVGAGKASAIDVTRIGKGSGNCAANNSKQPKQ